ncbi:caveolae-associated protein 2-like [Scyliorhinus canicula]|uniref:caveolae-associated protein 2-like n=1 Tax=Scyliorhinus canicula TaxID=7830 RepID=UPI0018F38785|nr:caveolae-associated protein 2-like [Scyliorhinus canicula]
MGEDGVQAEKSSAQAVQGATEPSPPPSPSPEASPSPPPSPAPGPAEAKRDASQVNAITVLALLDKLVNMLDTVQDNQRKMEHRQIGVESSVKGIQNDITKLSKTHNTTSNTVNKLLDKSRKVSNNVKEMRERLDRQAVQVKKLESNQAQLLKKNNFRVLIFQDEAEIPANVFVEKQKDVAAEECVDENKAVEDIPRSLELSSDEDIHEGEDNDELHDGEKSEKLEQSRAAKIKRSSMKKVDSIKKAFSRENIEKRMNKFGTKIVSPERREKIKKSLTPNQQKPQTAKTSSFKVTPMTFKVKKMRNGETPPQSPSDTVVTLEADPSGPPEDSDFPEVHLGPNILASEEIKEMAENAEGEIKEAELVMGSSNNRGIVMKAESTEEAEILLDTLPEDQQEGQVKHLGPNIELHIEEPDEPAVLQIKQTA